MRRRDAALLLVSAAVLGYQVVLVRAFSIGQWHHFAYMVISIALLGFGASGTLLAAINPPDPGRGTWARREGWFAASTTVFALALPASFSLAQKIPFDPYLIVWDRRELLYLGCYDLVLFVPFFAAATAIGLALIAEPDQCPRLYFFNLTGSGAGAAIAVGLLAVVPVESALLAVGGMAQGAAVLALLDAAASPGKRRALGTVAGLAAMLLLTIYFLGQPPRVRVSQYKGLSYALNLPEARLVAERSSPLGRVDVVASPAFRHAPGLSLVTPPEAILPRQLGLFVDAETSGAIAAFDGDTSKLAYLDWMTTASPYIAWQDSSTDLRACVLGAGGGSGVLLALRHGARRVDAVELDTNVVRLVGDTFREFGGALYDRPEVRVHRAEARAFLEANRETWDVIDLSLVDSFAAAAVGVSAVGENYVYTREALESLLKHLRPGGIAAITRWVRLPPRDELKLFATAVEALERMGLRAAERVVLIRSWATATLLIKKEAFTAAELAALRRWAEERLFDTAYSPGIAPGEGNRFNVLDRDFYGEAASALLAGPERREQFFRDYAFFLRPATDDRPYFFHFFRWQALPLMLSSVGATWIPFVEWGYLVLVATVVQVALLSVLLIALPLVWIRTRRAAKRASPRAAEDRISRLEVFLYFATLGLGYLFVEMALIQRLVFFLGNPVYAVSVVLAGLLLFSGLGSGWAARRMQMEGSATRLAQFAALGIAVVAILYAFSLRPLLTPLLSWPFAGRLGAAFAVILPLAAMGIPFPLALRRLGRTNGELLPWAWAINGCFSVVASPLATLVALGAGMVAVLLAAAACYLLAALVVRRWEKR